MNRMKDRRQKKFRKMRFFENKKDTKWMSKIFSFLKLTKLIQESMPTFNKIKQPDHSVKGRFGQSKGQKAYKK